MKFYLVEWTDYRLGRRRSHHRRKADAFKKARAMLPESDGRVDVSVCDMPTDTHSILDALTAAANLGTEGPTRYPGTFALVKQLEDRCALT